MSSEPPLRGITVLEVGVLMAAPFAAMQLADLGARVVKVENPAGGEPVRSTGPFLADGESSPFARLNRNKESVALDLKAVEGREAFLRLVETADVVMENFRPGAMKRLGLGYDDLAEVNPGIVYASASGWGQDGPDAHLAGLDIMAQARSGLMSITGTADGEPVKVGVPVCDLVCGLYIALAVAAALRERDRTGKGQSIDVSLLESGVSLAVWEAGRYFATGEAGRPLGSAHQNMAPYQAVRCRDGHATLGAITPKTWASLCAFLGLEHLLADERYSDAFRRHAHLDDLLPEIEAATTTYSVQDLVEGLADAGVPCAPISDYTQVFTDHHLVQRQFFWDAAHPSAGPARQIGSPMRFSRTPTVRGPAGPPLGAHTRTALLGAGYDEAEVDRLVAIGAVAERRSDDGRQHVVSPPGGAATS